MERYEINQNLKQFDEKLSQFQSLLKPESLQNEIAKLEEQMSASSFWDDGDTAQKIVQEANNKKSKLSGYTDIFDRVANLKEMITLDDDMFAEEIETEIKEIDEALQTLELQLLLNGKYDHQNAILEIHPGAGGTESQDWALMLYNMYLKYAESHDYKVELFDYEAGDVAGIKSVTLVIRGMNAYGYLKAEQGVHRLVRISPFDSNSRRHTSFASVDIMPEIDSSVEVEINEEDLKIDTYRSSGAGGQSVNTTDSAVRIKHIPTGTVVSCQNERSQIANRKKAMDYLKAKLYLLEEEKKREELASISGEKRTIDFGSQIRSYVLHPYSMVKDHRTNVESSQPDKVFDGALDLFISAFLRESKKHETE